MKPLLFLLLTFVLFAIESEGRPKWNELENYSFDEYKRDFGKSYATKEEEEKRRFVFERNLMEIEEFNMKEEKKWKKGVNQFSDQTKEEIVVRGIHKGRVFAEKQLKGRKEKRFEEIELKELPASVDWRNKGVVTDVKHQGNCGSCWTFAAAESIESQYAIQSGLLQDLSQQQILDCTPNPNECGGTGGCNGGTIQLAYQTLINSSKGLVSEWQYSYNSFYGEHFKCKWNQEKMPIQVKIVDYVTLPSNRYEPVMKALATVGPLAINVDASNWVSYESGVFEGCNDSNPDINHGVLLVGYGTDKEKGDYWIIRNSWGPSFGEKGYIRVKRSSTPTCGIDTNTKDGTICKGGPKTQKVCGHCGVLFDVSYPIVASPSSPSLLL